MSWIIFTDLDGTLLDHNTYSYEPALPALNRIKSLRVPLVFCSSKTAAELEEIRKALNSADPFISENGGGLHFPTEDEVIILGLPYEELQAHLLDIGSLLSLKYQTMKDMSVVELAASTGLSEKDALLAQRRNFDLAFIVHNPFEENVLEDEVKKRGLRLTRGARFFHLTGDNDKGRAVRKLIEVYQAKTQHVAETIGLGDSENDLPMLKEVDIPVIIPNPGSKAPVCLDSPNLIVAPSPGPAGWNVVVLSLLAD